MAWASFSPARNGDKMKKLISMSIALIFCISSMLTLVGCDSSPISNIIIANEQYSDEASLQEAKQPEALSKDSDVYASIYFIESPKGIKYTAVWSYNGEVIKTDEKGMTVNQHGIIVYPLEADKLKEGTLKLEIEYNDKILMQLESTVK